MKHHEYAEYIRSRTDLGPDQKKILIQDDLDRRKRGSGMEDTSKSEEPTEEEFEPIKRLEYKSGIWILGRYEEEYWALSSKSESSNFWYGPASTLEGIVEYVKDMQDACDDIYEDVFGEDEDTVYGSVEVDGRPPLGQEKLMVPYTIKKDDEHGYWGQFHPPRERDSVFVDGFFENPEQAESTTIQAIKSKYS